MTIVTISHNEISGKIQVFGTLDGTHTFGVETFYDAGEAELYAACMARNCGADRVELER